MPSNCGSQGRYSRSERCSGGLIKPELKETKMACFMLQINNTKR